MKTKVSIEEFIRRMREVCKNRVSMESIVDNPSDTNISYNKSGEIDHIWLHGNHFFKVMGDTAKCISHRLSYEKNPKTKEFHLVHYRWFDSKGWTKIGDVESNLTDYFTPNNLF